MQKRESTKSNNTEKMRRFYHTSLPLKVTNLQDYYNHPIQTENHTTTTGTLKLTS